MDLLRVKPLYWAPEFGAVSSLASDLDQSPPGTTVGSNDEI